MIMVCLITVMTILHMDCIKGEGQYLVRYDGDSFKRAGGAGKEIKNMKTRKMEKKCNKAASFQTT